MKRASNQASIRARVSSSSVWTLPAWHTPRQHQSTTTSINSPSHWRKMSQLLDRVSLGQEAVRVRFRGHLKHSRRYLSVLSTITVWMKNCNILASFQLFLS